MNNQDINQESLDISDAIPVQKNNLISLCQPDQVCIVFEDSLLSESMKSLQEQSLSSLNQRILRLGRRLRKLFRNN